MVTKNQFQSLLGSLLYICKCVKPARFFLNRMLPLLRDNFDNKQIRLNDSFFKDLNWFNTFLDTHNGVTFYSLKSPQIQIHLDACLTGLGGCYRNMVYYLPVDTSQQDFHITQLEMANVVVALKIFAEIWQNQRISLYCDNMAVVEVLKKGKTRDSYLATCARNIWLISSLFNIQLDIIHIPGKYNQVADLMSRWDQTLNPIDKLSKLVPNWKYIQTHQDLLLLNFSI